jgi:hypothetical protein
MIANSLPLTTSLYGNLSGITTETINQIVASTTTELIKQEQVAKLNVKLPTVPSNQRIAKE